MFAWLRKIRRINIFGFELEFDHSVDTRRGSAAVITPPPPARGTEEAEAPTPANLTVRGVVVQAIGKDLGLRVENDDEARSFWRDQRIDTKLDWAGDGPPVFSIGRKQDIECCRLGDEAVMTVEVQERSGGKRGIRTVDFRVVNRA